MGRLKKQFLFLSLWGISFGMIEGAVVIYLRNIYYPNGFTFPPFPLEQRLLSIELIREVATLALLWVTAELSEKGFQKKFAVFMILFGIWDIVYYIVLKLAIDWPESFFTWDILFLIPWIWAGPVLTPIVVSLGLVAAGGVVLYIHLKGGKLSTGLKFWIGEFMAGGLILTSFLIPGWRLMEGKSPEPYSWILFLVGFSVGGILFIQRASKSLLRD